MVLGVPMIRVVLKESFSRKAFREHRERTTATNGTKMIGNILSNLRQDRTRRNRAP